MTGVRKNWIEWLVFALSAVLVAGILGFLAHAAFEAEDSSARIEVFLGEPRSQRDGYAVPVIVRNAGGRPAAGVRVEVVLITGGESEHAGFDLDYSPAGSSRHGEVVFRRDPRNGILRARVPGFELP